MNRSDAAGQWPFRYAEHAVASFPDRSAPWYKMFYQRYRTVVGYWASKTNKDHEKLFRNQSAAKSYQFPKSEHSVQRRDLVLFYEGALDYAVAHLNDTVLALEISQRDQRDAVRSADQHAEESRNLRDALNQRDEEVEALRWTLGQIAKANKPDPILEMW